MTSFFIPVITHCVFIVTQFIKIRNALFYFFANKNILYCLSLIWHSFFTSVMFPICEAWIIALQTLIQIAIQIAIQSAIQCDKHLQKNIHLI